MHIGLWIALAAVAMAIGVAIGATLERHIDTRPYVSGRAKRARVRLERVGVTSGGRLMVAHYRLLPPATLDGESREYEITDQMTGIPMGILRVPRDSGRKGADSVRNCILIPEDRTQGSGQGPAAKQRQQARPRLGLD